MIGIESSEIISSLNCITKNYLLEVNTERYRLVVVNQALERIHMTRNLTVSENKILVFVPGTGGSWIISRQEQPPDNVLFVEKTNCPVDEGVLQF